MFFTVFSQFFVNPKNLFFMNEVLFSCNLYGKWGKQIFPGEDENTNACCICITDTITKDDKILGITACDDGMHALVLRMEPEPEEEALSWQCVTEQDKISYYAFGNFGLDTGKVYALQIVDVSGFDEKRLDDMDDQQALGILNNTSSMMVVYNKILDAKFLEMENGGNENASETSKIKPAFDPIYLGDMDHEIKDQLTAAKLWVISLNLKTVRPSTGDKPGKTGFERQIEDGSWRNCFRYRDVLEAAKKESGIDMYEDFLNNASDPKFDTIRAGGKAAFIRRRASDKSDKSEKSKAARM